MKIFLASTLFCQSLLLWAQNETLVVESAANMVFSGDIKLVLDNISLTNQGNLNVTNGEIVVSSASSHYLSTEERLYLNSLKTANNTVDFMAEGAFEVLDLTLGSTDKVTFSDTSSLTLTGNVNATGELKMESGAPLWIKASITETAMDNVTIERKGPHNNATGKYSVFGSPVASESFSVFGSTAQSWIYQYNESTKDFSTPGELNLTPNKGYFIAYPGDSEGKVTFNGTPNYRNQTYALTRTNTGRSNERGFNLISNPYTCPIDFDSFISNSTNSALLEESTIWIWDDYASDAGGGTSDDYLSINYLGANSYNVTESRNGGSLKWDGTLNVAQGFFVKVASSGDINFKHAMKTLDGNDDASFYRVGTLPKYWITIEDQAQHKSSSTLIGFTSDATYEKDFLYDATHFGTGLSVYTLLEEHKLSIQGLPADWLEGERLLSIGLGYNASEAGNYRLSLAHMEANELASLYLNDHLEAKSVNILSEPYTFDTEAGAIHDRFTLSLHPSLNPVLSEQETSGNLILYGMEGSLVLNAPFEGSFSVYTLSGKWVHEDVLTVGRKEVNLPGGTYVVAVKGNNEVNTYKIWLDE